MRQVVQYVYDYDELCKDAQQVAVNAEIEAMIELNVGSAGFKRAVQESEQMRTPWFLPEYVWEHCQDEILEALRQKEFTGDGQFYDWKDQEGGAQSMATEKEERYDRLAKEYGQKTVYRLCGEDVLAFLDNEDALDGLTDVQVNELIDLMSERLEIPYMEYMTGMLEAYKFNLLVVKHRAEQVVKKGD